MAVRRSARKSNEKASIAPLMTHFEVLVDRSGSMESMKQNGVYTPIEKMKEMIADQINIAKETGGIIKMSFTTFDDTAETYYINKDIGDLANITEEQWTEMLKPRHTTRLIDTAIERLSAQKDYLENFSSGLSKEVKDLNPIMKRVFVLYTDGYDNVSTKKSQDLNLLLKNEREKGLVAIFLGANQDAISTGDRFGFSGKTCITTGADGATAGVAMGYVNSICRAVSSGVKSNEEIEFTQAQRDVSAPRPLSPSSSNQEDDLLLPPPPPPYLPFSLNRVKTRPASPSYSPPPSHDPNMPYPLSTTPKSSHVSPSRKTVLPSYTFQEEEAINALLSLKSNS